MEAFDTFFSYLVYPTTAAFIIQTLLVFLYDMNDADIDHDSDFGMDSSKFTLRNMIYFFAAFTWAVIFSRESSFLPIPSLMIGLIAGIFLVMLVSYLFIIIMKLQHSGTMSYDDAIGKPAIVYLTIPKNGVGKVNVEIQGTERELDAILHDSVEVSVETGSIVEVVDHLSGLLVVKPKN
jgi:magnesium-transporting ATPase (P-type)